MRFGSPTRQNVVSKEEKEARLKSFVSEHLAAAKAAGNAHELTYRLLVLSAESPAARALAALAAELAESRVTVQIVLARRSETAVCDSAESRFVTDLRLLDAHEQLVLDDATVWIGDCMRRDPLRRDTYEQYSDKCSATAARAGRSFAQIWRAAGPSGSLAAGRRLAPVRHTPLFDPSLIAGADAAPAPALLRH